MKNLKKLTRAALSVAILVVFLFGAILLVWSRIDYLRLRQRASDEVRYQATLIGNQADSRFVQIDAMLRYIATRASETSRAEGLSEAFRASLRRESLLNPAVECLSVFNAQGEMIWSSSFCSAEDPWRRTIMLRHRSSGVDFSITIDEEKVIHISRSISGPDDASFLFFDAIVDNAMVLPQVDDPLFEETIAIGLQENNAGTLLLENYRDSGPDTASRLGELFREIDASSSGISGGTHVEITARTATGIYQLPSFPYYAAVVIGLDEWFASWRSQLVLSLSLVILLAGLLASTEYLIRQRFYYRLIERNNSQLESLNSELQRTSDERKLLVQEVHHRVKNNLTLINSIIDLMVVRGGPFTEKTLKDLNARILAIQKVHDSLFTSEHATAVAVDAYLRELVETIVSSMSSFPVTIEVDIAGIEMPSKTVIPLGILMTGLVTNALKYGLTPDGTLAIGGTLSGRDYVFTVRNSGKPYISDGAPGLGTILIQSLVDQLHGRLELSTEPETCFTLIFPAAEGSG